MSSIVNEDVHFSESSGQNPISATTSFTPTAGNDLIILLAGWAGSGLSISAAPTDNQTGNTWAIAVQSTNNLNAISAILTCRVVGTGSPFVITIPTNSWATDAKYVILEVNGLDTGAAVANGTASALPGAVDPATVTAGGTIAADSFVCGVGYSSGAAPTTSELSGARINATSIDPDTNYDPNWPSFCSHASGWNLNVNSTAAPSFDFTYSGTSPNPQAGGICIATFANAAAGNALPVFMASYRRRQ